MSGEPEQSAPSIATSPNCESLVFAVYQSDVEEVSARVPQILAEHPPVAALRVYFEMLAQYVRRKHDLGEELRDRALRRSCWCSMTFNREEPMWLAGVHRTSRAARRPFKSSTQ